MNEPREPSGAMRRQIDRRELLRMTGRGGLGLAALSFLAACDADVGRSGTSPSAASPTELPPLAKQLTVAQWPLYIDRAHGTHPSLDMFTDETGIVVEYDEKITDNQSFFAGLVPQFQSGQDTGWDLITLSDWVVTRMARAGWIESLDWSLLPTVAANMVPAFRDPLYDPGNAHSVVWQGGVTGIAYYPDKVGGTITDFAQLWDESLAGHVGMLTEMVDTMTLTLLSLGIDPQTATNDDAAKAAEKLKEQRDAGIVRKYYGQDYVDDMSRGDLWATMAWSGDAFYYKYFGGIDIEFAVPSEGGVIWATPMEIPALAQHPRDAHAFLDFYYRPEIAALVTDWVLYMSPVTGVQEIMQAKADDTKASAGDRRYYEKLATSPLLFPPTDIASANLFQYPVLSEEDLQTWERLFNDVVNGA